MKRFPIREVEIVAVNGGFDVGAGFKKPLARHITMDGLCYLELDENVETDHVIAKKLISEFQYRTMVEEDRITELTATPTACANARVLYARTDYRDLLQTEMPAQIDWHEQGDVRYAVARKQTCMDILNSWTEDTISQANERFSGFLQAAEPWSVDAQKVLAETEKLVDLSIHTAHDDRLLWRTWLFFGAVKAYSHNPEQVGLDFSRFVSVQFPNWDWFCYQKEISRLLDVLLQRSTPERHKQVVRQIDSRLRQVRLTTDVKRQVELASRFADVHWNERDERHTDVELAVIGDALPLTHELFSIISEEPAFFMPNVCDVTRDAYAVDMLEFLQATFRHELPVRTVGRKICEANDIEVGSNSVPIPKTVGRAK